MVEESDKAPTATAHIFHGEDGFTGAACIPQWVCSLLKLPAVSVVQVMSASDVANCEYRILVTYLAYHAVDPDQPYVLVQSADAANPKSNVRRVSGRLSSLIFAGSTLSKPLPKKSAPLTPPSKKSVLVTPQSETAPQTPNLEETEPQKPPSEETAPRTPPSKKPAPPPPPPKRSGPLKNATGDESVSRRSACRDGKQVGPKSLFQFGFGKARVQVDGKDVGILHKSKGAPISGNFSPTAYRVMYLFADNTDTVQALTDAALLWNFLRLQVKPPPLKLNKYQLRILKVHGGRELWSSQGLKESRSLDSIILPDGMLEKIVDDFTEFSAADTKDWYVAHGLPHRRSYLFYGPPGVGKTSTIRALAGALKLSAYFLSLGNANIGNAQLQEALRTIPKKAMFVIEDIDALFNKERMSTNTSLLTFSGLLNSLDGLVSAEGILTVMTTNHIDRLDAALVRAGRVDRKFEFRPPTHGQIVALFRSFYPDAPDELTKEFAHAVFERKEKDATSIATLQEHFICTRRKSAQESVDSLETFFTEFYPHKTEETLNSLMYR